MVLPMEMSICFPKIIASGMPPFCSVWATDVCRGSHTFLLRDVFAVIAIFCTTRRSLLLQNVKLLVRFGGEYSMFHRDS